MLDELGSYALSDFLLFSQETYYRTFELYNQAYWPLHLLTAAAGGFVLYALWYHRGAAATGIGWGLLAVLWGWVGWAFHLDRYATIHLAAPYFAALFVLGALILLLAAVAERPPGRGERKVGHSGTRNGPVPWAGAALLAYAILIHPLSGLLAGRTWTELSVFGMGPDPTVIGTMGAALTMASRARWVLLAVAVTWCVNSTLTAYAMGSAEGMVPALAAVLAVTLSFNRRNRGGRSA